MHFFTNPIVSHLLTAGIASAATWYATHKTQIKTLEATVTSVVTAIKKTA
jgi:hypothetical protein